MKRFGQIACLIVLVALVVWMAARSGLLPGLGSHRPLAHRELATRVLTEHLARQFPGKTAVVWSNPFSREPGHPKSVYEFEKAGLQGIEEGAGKTLRLTAVVYPELKPGARENPRRFLANSETTTPLSYLVREDALDQSAMNHPEAEIIVSLIGLPANVKQNHAWTAPPLRRFALLLPDLSVLGSDAVILEAFHSGHIAAAVVNKPGSPPENQRMGRDLRMEFDQRFLLLTPENVDHYHQVYRRLFAP